MKSRCVCRESAELLPGYSQLGANRWAYGEYRKEIIPADR